jgi:signal transduction histidine kinase/CheY-like chemotaxis protein/HPt (histidine-containing phosphotransfer) domain-containing protein
MLAILSRVSLWLAAVSAAVSLVTPGQQGALLASVALGAMIAAFVLRRFELKVRVAPLVEAPETVLPDPGTLLDLAHALTRSIAGHSSVVPALRALRQALIHELGAEDVLVHEPPEGDESLVVPARAPVGAAFCSRRVSGSPEAGYALPVVRGDRVIAMLELKGTALRLDGTQTVRLLELAKLQLDALVEHEAAFARAARAATEMEESQARFAVLAEALDEAMFVSDPDRSHFQFLGPSAFDTCGVSPERYTLDHASTHENVLEEDRPILAARREAELRGQPADVTYRIHHPARGIRWIRSRSRTRRLPDGSLRVCGLISDVTRDREHEVELERARDQAEAASLAKSQFMANMSHEIRTPMNGILGMTELLLGTTLNERQRRFAKAVYRSGESLLGIINDILDFSKMEAGKLELSPTDFVLRSVVEDTLELLAPRAHEKRLELSFQEAQGLPETVHADPLRLRQVLTNLIANAIKFTERGEVVVDLQRWQMDEGSPAADAQGDGTVWVEFTVRDTGIGIAQNVLPRVFTAFTQAHGGMSRRYGGTGLGLAISKQLIELMGGSIEVESTPGVGSCFRFRVPLGQAVGSPARHPPDAAELTGLRVLVVEDHDTSRAVLEHMLDGWGMDVTVAEDGERALDILRGRSPCDSGFDLALVDMHMPGMDGMAFGRALRAEGIQPQPGMILLSSVSLPDDAQTVELAGFDGSVAKPVRQAELRQAILGVAAQRREAVYAAPRLAGSVLVIEDNAVNQEVIGQMLRGLGLKVRVANGALQGLRALCEAHFDLILMDIQMPGMDGVEALSWFRRGSDGRFAFVTPTDTPVIAVTANALGGDEDRFLALGFDDYLSKPFRQSQLLAMLNKCLSAKPAAAASEGPLPGGAAPVGADTSWALPEGTEHILDAEALQRLRELDPRGENQLLSRVIKAFDTSASRLVPQVQGAMRAGDHAGVRHVAHTLKSSSASIGAMKLSQMCAEIEARIRTERLDQLDARVEAMCAEVQVVLQALKRLLDAPL